MFGKTRHASVLLILAASIVVGVGVGANSTARSEETRLPEPATSFLRQYCFDCHQSGAAESHVDLEAVAQAPNFAKRFKLWDKVVTVLDDRRMPPEDMPQPSGAERDELTKLIRHHLRTIAEQRAGDPGRVVMRRLTSAEYAYTIRDLTGLDLTLATTFVSDAVGGTGFTNVGDAQFIQDSTLERYLEAAKLVADHAVIGSGPLEFFSHPGMTGQELSAIHRIQAIYRQHGFRTAAGEGAEPFGLQRYPRAFYTAWRFRHRGKLGLEDVTLRALADDQGLDARFVEHIWQVCSDPSPSFPLSEIVANWRALPQPTQWGEELDAHIMARCNELYRLLRDWQSRLADRASDDEEAALLADGALRVSLKHAFKADVDWEVAADTAAVRFVVDPAVQAEQRNAIVIWRKPFVRFRRADNQWTSWRPLRNVLSEQERDRLAWGRHPGGGTIGANEFGIQGAQQRRVEFQVPEGMKKAQLLVHAELDITHGDDGLVRCAIVDESSSRETAADTGTVSAILANPTGPRFDSWKAGVSEFARKLPEVSHREPAPSDRDPIPLPYDNTYNSVERNRFHYEIKYHRDDRFLYEHILDDPTRRRLDQAWVDLLSSFDYHDTFLRFVAEKYELQLGDDGMADLDAAVVDALPSEPRQLVAQLLNENAQGRRALQAAQSGHVEDAIRLAQLAWRRPLTSDEVNCLRSFYTQMRRDAKLDHVQSVRALLRRILVAPTFLYRAEHSAGQGDAALSGWELANRLSYFLWASMPDAELRQAAAAGTLQDPPELTAQVRRMLRDPKARRFATEFFGQWFGFYRFDAYRGVDTSRFTEFSETLKRAMYDEAVSFFEHIVREDRPVGEILFADYAFVNGELARHYGIAGRAELTDRPTRIEGMNRFHRGGLLRLGAVLTVTSARLRTSAVKRGDWVLRRVLGTAVPPPPADAGSIPADDVLADGKTVRERLVAHRRDTSCTNCHSRIDPLGFALERFDAIGRRRQRYRDGQPIDVTGTLSDGTKLVGVDGLHQHLKVHQEKFHRTLITRLLGYALGRGELLTDKRLVEQMLGDLERDPRFSNLVLRIVTSRQFRFRRGHDPAEQISFTTRRDDDDQG